MDKSTMDVRMRQWADLLEKQMQSGLSKQEWCEQNGISRQKFFRWQRKIRSFVLQETEQGNDRSLPVKQMADANPGNGFAEILPAARSSTVVTRAIDPSLSACPSRTAVHSIDIRYGNFTVSLQGTVDEAALISVLRAVSHAGC